MPEPADMPAPVSKPRLELRVVGHKHAVYACKRWHYSRSVPAGKKLVVGVFEDGEFIGVVIFNRGATPNLGKPFGLKQTEIVELTRIAMRGHKSPLTKILAGAIRIMKQTSPGIRLIISYADPAQGHHGGIYQAANWLYLGSSDVKPFFRINGRVVHPRTIGSIGIPQTIDAVRRHLDANAEIVRMPPKHRYAYPLDRRMRKRLAKLAKPYPKPDTQ